MTAPPAPTAYKLMETDNANEMKWAVLDALKEGWVPQGGCSCMFISQIDHDGYRRYTQAMVMY